MHIRSTAIESAAAILMLCTVASGAYAQKRWDAPKIVVTYCSGCHGIDGDAQVPYIPKLAGLSVTYTERKLGAFGETSPPVDELYWLSLKTIGVREEPGNLTPNERISMEGVAHAAKPELIRNALLWYSQQRPSPGHLAGKADVQEGRELFAKGLPAQKVLPCMTCQGVNAEGKGPAPRLAGQNAAYLEDQLETFRRGDRKHAPEMTLVTRDLDPAKAHAVSLYLQSK